MKCCICGTVRNCGNYLYDVFNNIDKISSLFDEVQIIVYYDVSTDNTLGILQKIQEIKPYLSVYINTEQISQYRVQNIAKGRNYCLEQVFKYNYEYFIMMDFDDVCSSEIQLHNLQTSLERNDWDALSFNKNPYYDLWALSIYPYSFSCMHFKNWNILVKKYIENILENTDENDLIKCFSAFNGFSIYKTEKFVNCFYDSRPRIDLVGKKLIQQHINVAGPMYYDGLAKIIDCEHRSFHFMSIKKNGACIRISPKILF